jgi:hypothetical protein
LYAPPAHILQQFVFTVIGHLKISGIPHLVPKVISKAGRWVRGVGSLNEIDEADISDIPPPDAKWDHLTSWWLSNTPSQMAPELALKFGSASPKVSSTTGCLLLPHIAIVGEHGARH